MKSYILAVTALSILSITSTSCEKETFHPSDNSSTMNTTKSKLEGLSFKGEDDEYIIQGLVTLQGGSSVMSDGEVRFFDAVADTFVLDAPTDSNGEFEASVLENTYIIKCYKDNVYKGSSGQILVDDDLTLTINL